MASEEPDRHYVSVQLRLRRVTTEFCYINVPMTSDLMIPQADGTGRLNVEMMVARAAEISRSPDVTWYIEEQNVEPHPIQKPTEPGEERFEGLFPADS